MNLEIIHVQALSRGVILHLDRMAIEEQVVPLVFPPGRFPEGIPAGASLTQWKGRFDQWHLIVTREVAVRLDRNLFNAIVLASPFTLEEIRRQQEADEQRRREVAQWWQTYHPILGMAPAKARPGWYERKGHFIWIGNDPHDFHSSFQIEPVSDFEPFNKHVRYYLERGLSLRDTYLKLEQEGRELNLVAAMVLAGMGESALAIVERQAAAEEARMHQLIEQELDADRAALEAAIKEGLQRVGR